MRAHRDRADARAAAPVRDAERLVQVEVADVRAEVAGPGEPDQRVQVRAVDVDLAATGVHDLAQLADPRLEHAVRGGVRDHDRREPVGRGIDLTAQVAEIDVAVVVAPHHHHLHAGHHRARGVGAVRTRRDEAHRALVLAATAVVRTNREEARELALATGVRLQAHRVVAGDLAQRGLELGDHPPVPGGLIVGCEGMHVRELGPGDRFHLRGGVELHGARPERDHRAIEREITIGEPTEVAEHLVLAVVAVEHVLRQDLVGAQHRCRDAAPVAIDDAGGERCSGHGVSDGLERLDGGRLVERDAHRRVRHATQVDPRVGRPAEHHAGVDPVDHDRVEHGVVAGGVAV